MKKAKIISAILALTLSMTSIPCIPVTAFSAADVSETTFVSGDCEDGELVIPETKDGATVTEVYLENENDVKTVKIPVTVKKVTVLNCPNITSYEVAKDNPYLCSVDGVIYDKDMKTVICYPPSKDGKEFIVPDTVEEIGDASFIDAQNLEKIKLPDKLTYIGEGAFAQTKIVGFDLPEGLISLKLGAFAENTALTRITLPASLKYACYPFQNCTSLKEVVILHENPVENLLSAYGPDPDDDQYSTLLDKCSNVTVFVPDSSYDKYKQLYYQTLWSDECSQLLPISEYEKYLSDMKKVHSDGKDITLDDIDELHQKGYELTWKDFEEFNYVDVSSEYEIAYEYQATNGMKVCITGKDTENAPERVYLINSDGIMGDIRSDELEAFFSKPVMYLITEYPDIDYKAYVNLITSNGNLYQFGIDISDLDSLTDVSKYRESFVSSLRGNKPTDLKVSADILGYIKNAGNEIAENSKQNEFVECTGYTITSKRERLFLVNDGKSYSAADFGENFRIINNENVRKFLAEFVDAGYSEYISAVEISNISGDANCDNKLDMSDAVLIMQTIANPSKYKLTEQGSKNADMDGDGITSGDALAIQKKLLKLD